MADGVAAARARLQAAIARQLHLLGVEEVSAELLAVAGAGFSPESCEKLREALRNGEHVRVWRALAMALDDRDPSICFYGLRHVQAMAEIWHEMRGQDAPVAEEAWLDRWKRVGRRHGKDKSVCHRLENCLQAWIQFYERQGCHERAQALRGLSRSTSKLKEKAQGSHARSKHSEPEQSEVEMAIVMSLAEKERDDAQLAKQEADYALALERSKMDVVADDLQAALIEVQRQARILEENGKRNMNKEEEEENRRMKWKLQRKEKALEEAIKEMRFVDKQLQQHGVDKEQADAVQEAVLADVLDKLTLSQASGLHGNAQSAAGVHSKMMLEMQERFERTAGNQTSHMLGNVGHGQGRKGKEGQTAEVCKKSEPLDTHGGSAAPEVVAEPAYPALGEARMKCGNLTPVAATANHLAQAGQGEVRDSKLKKTQSSATGHEHDAPAETAKCDPQTLLQSVIQAGVEANTPLEAIAKFPIHANGQTVAEKPSAGKHPPQGRGSAQSTPSVASQHTQEEDSRKPSSAKGSHSPPQPASHAKQRSTLVPSKGGAPHPPNGKGGPPPPPPPPPKGKGGPPPSPNGKGGPPPPPPPPPPKGKGGPSQSKSMASGTGKAPPPPPFPTSTKEAAGQIRRAPQVISVYQQLRRASLRGPSTRTASVRGSNPGAGGPQFRKEDLASELESRSSHVKAIKRDVEQHKSFIEALAKEVSNLTPRAMDDLVLFVDKVDEALGILTDERAVLKHFEWPEDRMDAFRESSTLYRELRLAKRTMLMWDRGTRNAKEECQRIEKHLDKVQKRVEALQRSQDADERRFIAHGIPWDKSIITQVQHSSLTMGQVYLELKLQEVEKLRGDQDNKSQSTAHNQLTAAVRFAFKLHQFASGFDDACLQLFDRIQELFSEHARAN
eukprot:scaffold659_cov318-Pavlova_lutheri.AAC.19